jgi:hypothetical protein
VTIPSTLAGVEGDEGVEGDDYHLFVSVKNGEIVACKCTPA